MNGTGGEMKYKIIFLVLVVIIAGILIFALKNNKKENIDIKNDKEKIYELFNNFPESQNIYYSCKSLYSTGMIFIKNNKIVYDEKFKTDFESPYIFVIYPYKDINNEKKVNIFSKDNAIFKAEKVKYNAENRYVLKPI